MTTHELQRPANQTGQGDGPVKETQSHRASGGPPDQKHPVIMLGLDSITVDADLQCRAAVNPDMLEEYAQRMKAGDKFPPMAAFEVNGNYLLVDGWHRHPAALKAGFTEFPVEVHRGTRNDALRYALQANATHGLPRTNRDKRRAVALAVDEFPEDSDRVIAALCKVSHVFVGNVRRELVTVTSSDTRLGRDGKKRKLPQNRGVGHSKTRAASNPKSGESGGQAKPGNAAQSSDGGQEPKPAARAGEASKDFHFWDEWVTIEDYLEAELKKMPAERWRRELASQLYKFADRRCW